MNKTQRKRFEKLASFLDALPRKNFDFGTVMDPRTCQTTEAGGCRISPECGTVGCAIGWTPKVFPRLVRARMIKDQGGDYLVRDLLRGQEVAASQASYGFVASSLFGLKALIGWGSGAALGEALFSPGYHQVTLMYGTKFSSNLPGTATPREVAGMMRRFLKAVDKDQALGAKRKALR